MLPHQSSGLYSPLVLHNYQSLALLRRLEDITLLAYHVLLCAVSWQTFLLPPPAASLLADTHTGGRGGEQVRRASPRYYEVEGVTFRSLRTRPSSLRSSPLFSPPTTPPFSLLSHPLLISFPLFSLFSLISSPVIHILVIIS